jgi:hypothetical protein
VTGPGFLLWSLGLAALLGLRTPPPVILLDRSVRDSMRVVFQKFNQHWDELGDLNSLERMLGTVRPTQLEYLGCLQGEISRDTVWVQSWQPARNLKQLQLAVGGDCDKIPRLVGTWHTHPYRADAKNQPIKERSLSAQDLETFEASPLAVTLVMWDADSLDGAVKAGRVVVHPARVLLKEGFPAASPARP